jgi:hypothetical protein
MDGIGWCVRVYLPACLRLLAFDRCADTLAEHPPPGCWPEVPEAGLTIWTVVQQWQRASPALPTLNPDLPCPPVCHQLSAAKVPALRTARQCLDELIPPASAEDVLEQHWSAFTSRPSRALSDWTVQRELRAGGPAAASLTLMMINRLGDELVHVAAGMAVRLAEASNLTTQASAQPLALACAHLAADLELLDGSIG